MACVQYMVLAQTIGLEAWYLKLQGKPENYKQSESKYFLKSKDPWKDFCIDKEFFYNIVFMLLFIKVEISSKQSKCWMKHNLKQD